MNWRRFFHRGATDAEQRRELDFYVQLTTDEYIERGMEPGNAPGKRIRPGRDAPWTEVVGVTENVYADGVNRPVPPTVHLRAGVDPPVRPGGTAVVRRVVTFANRSERAGTEAFLRDITSAIHAVNPGLPLAKVRTLHEVYRRSLARTSFALVLLGIAAAAVMASYIPGRQAASVDPMETLRSE